MTAGFTLAEVRVGRARPYGPGTSAIDKAPVSGPVMAGPEGLAGDEQADRRHHGGPDKALHAYAVANYPLWAAEMPDRAGFFRPGAFGENLVVEGLDEAGICLGDRWRLGKALVEVSQGRQPCWKLNDRFGVPDMARRVQDTGRTGWYYRVLQPGVARAGDTLQLLERPCPDWPLQRLMRLLAERVLDPALLREALALPLVPSWRKLVERRLESSQVEDWTRRIEGPAQD